MSYWPAALRLKTRRLLDGIDPFPTEGILWFKNINDFSAYLKFEDLQNGQIILYDAETKLTTCFQTVGEMFDAGWIAEFQSNSQAHLLPEGQDMVGPKAPHAVIEHLFHDTETTEANKIVPFKGCKFKEKA